MSTRARSSGVQHRTFLLALAGAWAASLLPAAAPAQQRDSIPGVSLGLLYETGVYQPALALKPFMGRFGGQTLAGQVEAIVARDLRYSDRYQVMDSIPQSLMREGAIDYTLWDRLGAVWLLSGQVEGSGEGYVLVLELHDVVYGQLKERGTFRLPDAGSADFRMAVHRASDQVVQWTFGEPGIAASRIAFSMLREGAKELYLVDSDGENLQRLTSYGGIVMSPAWSPDGGRLAFLSDRERPWDIFEMDLATRRARKLDLLREGQGQLLTPAYHPSGDVLAFGVGTGRRSGIYSYNVARNCCLTNLTETARDDFSPVYSPDGRWLAFNSTRLGTAVPQIYVMPAGGGEPRVISPYEYGKQGFYASPDWSPRGDLLAFHGRISRSGDFQILVARMGEQGKLLQLTWEGNNEDPSWGPDGRHLSFRGERRWGKGLFVVDTVTGTIRPLLSGVDVTVPQWSPALKGAGAVSPGAK